MDDSWVGIVTFGEITDPVITEPIIAITFPWNLFQTLVVLIFINLLKLTILIFKFLVICFW